MEQSHSGWKSGWRLWVKFNCQGWKMKTVCWWSQVQAASLGGGWVDGEGGLFGICLSVARLNQFPQFLTQSCHRPPARDSSTCQAHTDSHLPGFHYVMHILKGTGWGIAFAHASAYLTLSFHPPAPLHCNFLIIDPSWELQPLFAITFHDVTPPCWHAHIHKHTHTRLPHTCCLVLIFALLLKGSSCDVSELRVSQ